MLNQDIIDKAIRADETALIAVREHYKPYIRKVCTEPIRKDYKTEYGVNSEMEGEIITHLLLAIIRLKEKEEKNGTDTVEHR